MRNPIIDGGDKSDITGDFSEQLAEHFNEELTDEQLDEFERQYGKLQTKDNQSRRNRFKKLVEEGGK